MSTEVDMVNHPPHYKQGGVEVIEITRHCDFDIGNAIKYILRHEHKGNPQQDLDKARWYLTDYVSNFGTVYRLDEASYHNLGTAIRSLPPSNDPLGIDMILMEIRSGFPNLALNLLKKKLRRDYA